MAGAGGHNRRERPTTGKTADDAALLLEPGSLIDDESVEDEFLVEALTSVLLAGIVVIHIRTGAL